MFLLPLVSTLTSSIFSGSMIARHLGHRGCLVISIFCLFISFISSVVIWYEVCFGSSEVYIDLFGPWFTVGSFNVSWAVYIDLYTAHMLLTVTSVSTAVHCYAVVYMRSDPHLNLFLSYLSLFTFFMLVLVCSESLINMLVGWEGIQLHQCLSSSYAYEHMYVNSTHLMNYNKVVIYLIPIFEDFNQFYINLYKILVILNNFYHFYDNLYMFLLILFISIIYGLFSTHLNNICTNYGCFYSNLFASIVLSVFITLFAFNFDNYDEVFLNSSSNKVVYAWFFAKLPADSRKGCHSPLFYQILTGALLGDGNLECRQNCQGNFGSRGVRFSISLKSTYSDVANWYNTILYGLGYNAKLDLGEPLKRISRRSGVIYYYQVRTFTFSNLLPVYNNWYVNRNKVVPYNVEKYLTPLALALWFMGDGSAMKGGGLKLSTHGFTLADQQRLANILTKLYGFKVTLHKDRQYYHLYIWAESVPKFKTLVMPYMHSSCMYKLS